MSTSVRGDDARSRIGRFIGEDQVITRGRLIGFLSLVVGLIAWEIIAGSMSSVLIAPPTAITDKLVELWLDGSFPNALVGTIQVMFIGYFIAIAITLPLGFLIAQSKRALWALNPYIDAAYTAPTIVYLPLIVVWFGIGFQARVFYVILFCFFEILIDVYQGISTVKGEYSSVAESFGASWWERQRKVMLPASMPFIFTGLRLGMGRAVRGVIVAEIFLKVVNIGAILTASTAVLDTAQQLAAVVVVALLGAILQGSLRKIEHRVIPWHFARGEE